MHTIRLLLLSAVFLGLAAAAMAEERLRDIRLPPGFAIEVFARVPGARSIALAPELGTVFVSTRGDKVYAVPMAGGAAEAVLGGLRVANAIAWDRGRLYVAEQHRIVRYRAGSLATLKRARPEILFDALPDDPWHGWRYMRIGPDGMLYVGVGAPCNVCEVSGLEGTIIRLAPEGGTPEIFATGVRNSVGMDFHPRTEALFFTDNGADRMGDDVPPDELNHAPAPGLHFGFPHYGGGNARTPAFQDKVPPASSVFPVPGAGNP